MTITTKEQAAAAGREAAAKAQPGYHFRGAVHEAPLYGIEPFAGDDGGLWRAFCDAFVGAMPRSGIKTTRDGIVI